MLIYKSGRHEATLAFIWSCVFGRLMKVRQIFLLLAAKCFSSSLLCLVDIVLTYIVEPSFGQLVGPDGDTRRPVDKCEQPLFTLLHGRIRHITEGCGSCRQLRSDSSGRSCRSSGQRHVVGSVPPHETTVWIMPLVFGYGPVTWLPVTQLRMQTNG